MNISLTKKLVIVASLLAFPLSSQAVIWIHDDDALATIDPNSGIVTDVGSFGVNDTMTDIAFDSNGDLFGISFGRLYSINSSTGAATSVGPGWATGMNALEIVGTTAYAMSSTDDNLWSIDLGTGIASNLGSLGTGTSSSGDLALFNGDMYGSINIPADNALLDVDVAVPGASSIVGAGFGVTNIFGLAEDGGLLYALESGGGIYTVNTGTGTLNNIGSAVFTSNVRQIFGATSTQNTTVPDGGTTLPLMALPLLGVYLLRRKLVS
ncbi:MAG: hypothetical protein ACKV19_04290 [Verrucomicrobiales bacterium]